MLQLTQRYHDTFCRDFIATWIDGVNPNASQNGLPAIAYFETVQERIERMLGLGVAEFKMQMRPAWPACIAWICKQFTFLHPNFVCW